MSIYNNGTAERTNIFRESKAKYDAYLAKRKEILDLMDKIKRVDLRNSDENEEARVFEKLAAPIVSKEKCIKKLLKEAISSSNRSRGQNKVTPLILTDPETCKPRTMNVVDFAAMSPDEVFYYDGKYGGEEQNRALQRLEKKKCSFGLVRNRRGSWESK